jgi:hypothetical protein
MNMSTINQDSAGGAAAEGVKPQEWLLGLLEYATDGYQHAAAVSGSALLAGEKKSQTPAQRRMVYDEACRALGALFCLKDELEKAIAASPATADCGNTPYDEGPFTIAGAAPAAAAQVSDEELTAIYKRANGEDTGKAKPLTTANIFRAMRAAILSRASSHQAARDAEPVMLNGLTQAETDATASVMGLVHKAAPSGDVPSASPLPSPLVEGRSELPRRQRLVEEFYSDVAEKDWPAWAAEAVNELEKQQ